jgi:hypothetical protein
VAAAADRARPTIPLLVYFGEGLTAPEGQLAELQRRRLVELETPCGCSTPRVRRAARTREELRRRQRRAACLGDRCLGLQRSPRDGRGRVDPGRRDDSRPTDSRARAGQNQILFQAMQLRALAGRTQRPAGQQNEELQAVRAGNAEALGLEPYGDTRAEVVGLRLATTISEAASVFDQPTPDRAHQILPVAVPPVAELLTAMVLHGEAHAETGRRGSAFYGTSVARPVRQCGPLSRSRRPRARARRRNCPSGRPSPRRSPRGGALLWTDSGCCADRAERGPPIVADSLPLRRNCVNGAAVRSRRNGAAKESNLPTAGLRRPAGFEGTVLAC